jgi:hypothetical protein
LANPSQTLQQTENQKSQPLPIIRSTYESGFPDNSHNAGEDEEDGMEWIELFGRIMAEEPG